MNSNRRDQVAGPPVPVMTGVPGRKSAGHAPTSDAWTGGRVAVLEFVVRYGLGVVLTAMIVWFFVQEPRLLSLSNLLNVSRTGSALAILATGMAFVMILGHIDISVGSIVGAASVASAWGAVHFGLIGMLAGPFVGLLVGLVNGFLVARFNIHSVIVTIGMLTALRGATLTLTDGSPIFKNLPENYSYIGSGYFFGVPVPAVIAAVVMIVSVVVLRMSRFGPIFYAIGGNEQAVNLAGINTFRYKVAAFMVTGALAGITGTVLSARINSGQPNLGVSMELDAIAAAVIGGLSIAGGRGRIGGVLLGVAVLTLLQNGLNLTNVSSFAQMMITGLVIIAAVVADSVRRRSSV